MSVNLRKKGSIFLLHICIFGKRGSIFIFTLQKSAFCKKNKGSVLSTQQLFQVCESQHSKEKWYKLRSQKSAFSKKGVLSSMKKSVERGRFVFWRTIIRPPFTFDHEWRDRATGAGQRLPRTSCQFLHGGTS